MDWERIKQAANDFDALVEKRITPEQACEDARVMLAALMYCDANWIAESPKSLRKEYLERVYPPFQDDVKDMASLIIKGEI